MGTEEHKKSTRSGFNNNVILLVFLDAIAINISYFLALWFRFDCRFSEIPQVYLSAWMKSAPFYTAFSIFVFWLFKMYRSLWRYASYAELRHVLRATAVANLVYIPFITIVFTRMPVSFFVFGIMIQLALLVGIRFSYRVGTMVTQSYSKHGGENRVMIVGAGSAGRLLLKDIKVAKEYNDKVCCFIDDDPAKWGKLLEDVTIVGGRDQIMSAVKQYEIQKIYVAMPSASAEARRDILNICKETGCDLKNIPGIYQMANGEVTMGSLKNVSIDDLLGREPIKIGSVRDSRRIYDVFEKYKPEIVYHAAAHKHVPLMEDSPNEAIKNNVIGTYKTAYAAMVHHTERFVLVSTDKAVNPTNIMGASKRLCEMIIQSFDAKIKEGKPEEIPELFTHEGIEVIDPYGEEGVFENVRTEYVAVRFGNVLGSNGSVVPLFKKWIEKGEPLRVTHPDIIRYFMTILEAASLVLLAGTYAKGGEIFVLDMGSPVKIDDLARNMIRLSGLRPDIDVKIIYTGLRPGEKLYEEKLMAEEGLKKTDNNLIHIGCPIPFDNDVFLVQMGDLMRLSYLNRVTIRDQVVKMVSTYHPEKAGVNAQKDKTYEEQRAEMEGKIPSEDEVE